MKRLVIVTLLLAACSSNPNPVTSAAPHSPSPTVLTASAYWDQHPSDLHKLCAEMTVFAQFVGWSKTQVNELAYRTYRKDWTATYYPASTDPASTDAFAEAVDRCGL